MNGKGAVASGVACGELAQYSLMDIHDKAHVWKDATDRQKVFYIFTKVGELLALPVLAAIDIALLPVLALLLAVGTCAAGCHVCVVFQFAVVCGLFPIFLLRGLWAFAVGPLKLPKACKDFYDKFPKIPLAGCWKEDSAWRRAPKGRVLCYVLLTVAKLVAIPFCAALAVAQLVLTVPLLPVWAIANTVTGRELFPLFMAAVGAMVLTVFLWRTTVSSYDLFRSDR